MLSDGYWEPRLFFCWPAVLSLLWVCGLRFKPMPNTRFQLTLQSLRCSWRAHTIRVASALFRQVQIHSTAWAAS